jgi:hypothetical protein
MLVKWYVFVRALGVMILPNEEQFYAKPLVYTPPSTKKQIILLASS